MIGPRNTAAGPAGGVEAGSAGGAEAGFAGGADDIVVVVDDDAGTRLSLEMLLDAAGHRAACFASAAALLAEGLPRGTCCMLVDVRLEAGEDGITLVEALRAAGDRTPVVVMTGHGDVPLAVRAMRAGALDFIEKPYTEDRLLAAMAAARTEGSGRSRALAAIALLTAREREVLERLVEGKANKVVAAELGISPRTVEAHRAAIMQKLGVASLAETVRIALSAGIGW